MEKKTRLVQLKGGNLRVGRILWGQMLQRAPGYRVKTAVFRHWHLWLQLQESGKARCEEVKAFTFAIHSGALTVKDQWFWLLSFFHTGIIYSPCPGRGKSGVILASSLIEKSLLNSLSSPWNSGWNVCLVTQEQGSLLSVPHPSAVVFSYTGPWGRGWVVLY